MDIGRARPVRQLEERHTDRVGGRDGVVADRPDRADGADAGACQLRDDPAERQGAVEQVEPVERHDRELAAPQRVERRRVGAQNDRPGHRPVEAGLASDQLRAGRQKDLPGSANGDVGHVHLLRSYAERPRAILDGARGA